MGDSGEVQAARITGKTTLIGGVITCLTTIFVTLYTSGFFEIRDGRHFDGVWEYEATFNPFHNNNETYHSHGIAVFRWNYDKQGYEVYHSYKIEKQWDDTDVVTGFGEGFLPAKEGWPEKAFQIDLKYEGRTGLSGYEGTGRSSYKMTNLSYTKPDSSDQINELNGKYEFKHGTTISTAGLFTLKRR